MHARRLLAPLALATAMLLLLAATAVASSLGTRYTFEDGTAQGWYGGPDANIYYNSVVNTQCKGYYCWRANLTDGTHQYITTTYDIAQAGIYKLDAYFLRRGTHRLYSASTDVDGYGIGNSWTQTTFDYVWYHQTMYMGLVTGTWAIGAENWGTVTPRTFDSPLLDWYGPMRTPANGLVCDGEFEAPYDANWELYDPNGDSYYASTFGYGQDYGDYDIDLGSMRLYAGDRMTTTIVVPEGAGSLAISIGHGWNTTSNSRYYLYTEAGALVDTKLFGLCGGTWCVMSDSWGTLAAGNYTLVIYGGTTPYTFIDGVTVSCSNPGVCVASGCTYTVPEAPAEEQYWNLDAWVYYPLEATADLGFFQPYTQTSAYGTPYEGYNIYETTADATAYAIASMDITAVGSNAFGYWAEAQIDSWTDVPSTTIRYEGLASLSVKPGQHVSAQCPIGAVARRPEFSGYVYHLLLGVWYPDTSTIFNPVPYMTRRPSPGSCLVVTPPEVITPSGGGGLWEPVCRDCIAPDGDDIWSLGAWIDWLGCQITNLILCWMVRIINTVIAWIVGLFNLGLNALGWASETINEIVAWASDLWSNTIAPGMAVMLRSGIAVLLQTDLFQTVWMFLRIAWLFFNQMLGLLYGVWDLMSLVGTVVENLITLMSDLIAHMIAAFTGTKADIFDFFGVDTGLGGDASGIPHTGGSLSWPEFEAAIAATGANQYKALYITVLGVGTADAVIGDTGLVVLTYILMAGVGWSLLTWTLKQFQDIISF